MNFIKWMMCSLVLFVMMMGTSLFAADSKPLNLYAGAGLKKSLDVIIEKYIAAHGNQVVPNYGPSGGLYTQISKGQPCDIYFSADWRFIEKLKDDNLLAEGKKFMSDSIVLIVSKTGVQKIIKIEDITKPEIVLCVADPRAPVGAYTENGLKKLGLWDKLMSQGNIKAKPTTVNQVAIMVQEDQVDAGFIFKSVASMYGLPVIATMEQDLTGEIIFGIGIIKGENEARAREFMKFASENIAEFSQYGWKPYE